MRPVAPTTNAHYSGRMVDVVRSETYERWLGRLRDRQGKAKILTRVDRLIAGHPGDTKHIRDKVHELRIDHGPGYRVYYAHQDGRTLLLLLTGGDKSTQSADIDKAVALLAEFNAHGGGTS